MSINKMLTKAETQISKIEQLHDGWRGAGSHAPNADAIAMANAVVHSLISGYEIAPNVYATAGGGVVVEKRHYETDAETSITIFPDGSMLRYADDGSEDPNRSWGDEYPVWFDEQIAVDWMAMDFAYPSQV